MSISYRELNQVEEQRFQDWRNNHGCVSQVQFQIVVDNIDQDTWVMCQECKERKQLTDWDCA